MPRETIRRLSEDTERLLIAGAHLARGNPELSRDKDALDELVRKLGPKAPPAFSKLSEQIGKTLGAGPREQASELVSLATAISQVRAGMAQLAPTTGEDAPVPRAPEVDTPCNAKDLYALHDALVEKGQGRMEVIQGAIERGDVADLRLVHAVVQSMSDPYVGAVVADRVVPHFGRAIVDPVRRKLRFPGTTIDGRRLRALVAVERAGARDLIDRALTEGSAELRAAALEAIADHLPGQPDLEPVALATLASDRSADVRRAAVRALAGHGSDATLTSLLEALDDERTLHAAAEALGRSTHPQVVERLLERLGVAVLAAKAKVKKGDAAAQKSRERQTVLVARLLGALAHYPDPRVPRAALALLDDHGAAAASAVIAHGAREDLRVVADRLDGDDEALYPAAVAAAHKLPDEVFDRLSRPLRGKDLDGKLGKARLDALWRSERVPADPRWVPALVEAARRSPRPPHVVALLGRAKDARAVDLLLELLESEAKPERAAEIERALGQIGDRRALPAILARLEKRGRSGYWYDNAILALADETTVDRVRTLYARAGGKKAGEDWYLGYLLRQLERRFPGH